MRNITSTHVKRKIFDICADPYPTDPCIMGLSLRVANIYYRAWMFLARHSVISAKAITFEATCVWLFFVERRNDVKETHDVTSIIMIHGVFFFFSCNLYCIGRDTKTFIKTSIF